MNQYLKELNSIPAMMWNRMKRLGAAIAKSKEKLLAEKLTEGRIHIVSMQKLLIEEEVNEKRLKIGLLKEEMLHKREIYELQKQAMMVELEASRTNLENLKAARMDNNNAMFTDKTGCLYDTTK